jgi:hypothetical protein
MRKLAIACLLLVTTTAFADHWDSREAKTKWVAMGALMYYTNEVEVGVPGIYGQEISDDGRTLTTTSQVAWASFRVEASAPAAQKALAAIERAAPRKHTAMKPLTKKFEKGTALAGKQYTWSERDSDGNLVTHVAGQGLVTNASSSRIIVVAFDLAYPDSENSVETVLYSVLNYAAFGPQKPDA